MYGCVLLLLLIYLKFFGGVKLLFYRCNFLLVLRSCIRLLYWWWCCFDLWCNVLLMRYILKFWRKLVFIFIIWREFGNFLLLRYFIMLCMYVKYVLRFFLVLIFVILICLYKDVIKFWVKVWCLNFVKLRMVFGFCNLGWLKIRFFSVIIFVLIGGRFVNFDCCIFINF